MLAARLAMTFPQVFFFTRVTGPRRPLSLKLRDTRVYEPQIRARLGTSLNRGPCHGAEFRVSTVGVKTQHLMHRTPLNDTDPCLARCRGGLVFEAHRLLYHPAYGSRTF